jgi:hypothetical protein
LTIPTSNSFQYLRLIEFSVFWIYQWMMLSSSKSELLCRIFEGKAMGITLKSMMSAGLSEWNSEM